MYPAKDHPIAGFWGYFEPSGVGRLWEGFREGDSKSLARPSNIGAVHYTMIIRRNPNNSIGIYFGPYMNVGA